MRELLDRMERIRPLIAASNPGLAHRMQTTSEQGADPDRAAQVGFRHRVAYVFEDLEKTPIGRIEVPQELRQEMTRLAASAPGLENERMLSLMRSTPTIQDRSVVRDIRGTGVEIGRHVDQSGPEALSHVEALENRLRLTARQAETLRAGDPPPDAVAAQAAESGPAPPPDRTNEPPQTGRRMDNAPQNGVIFGGPGGQNAQQGQQVTFVRPALDTIMAGMRGKDQGTGAPWDPPPTPMAERISAFEKKMMDSQDERVFQRATTSSGAALDALQSFTNHQGASIMGRIQQAARNDPDGMAGVLSEMHEGGKFSDLRRQFNAALATDRSLAAAYDKAASALSAFGQDRAVVQDIIARRPDASALTQRFEKMDAEIGEAAANAPSRNDGRSMLNDLSDKAAELVKRAVEAVRSAFSRSPSAGAASSPSPSP